MLYDRPYMRQEEYFERDIPALKWIIVANVVGFVLEKIFLYWFGSAFFSRYFYLSWDQIRSGFVWTILSYSLIHANFTHILFNMIVIFFFGRSLQTHLGGYKLLELYLLSVLTGALFWLVFNLHSTLPVVGASAGAMGLVTAFCLWHYFDKITVLLFFFLPLTLTGKQMLTVFFGWEAAGLVFWEAGPLRSLWPFFFRGIAYSAHLGGILAGFVYYKFLRHRGPFLPKKGPLIEVPRWVKKKTAVSSKKRNFNINISNRKQLKSEVDRILDKINSKGFGALNEEEKRTLDKAKDILSH